MNLAYKYPIIFWDTANLIVDSGSMNLSDEINLDDDEDEEDDEKEKIKNSSTDYGRIAAAIGKMQARGLSFSLPNINISGITFSPDLNHNRIIYGLRGINRIGNQLIKDIFNNRPYSSIGDFLSKVKVNKTQMINLIKAGAFDELYNGQREELMSQYLLMIADQKKKITLQNMQMLIAKNLIPEKLDFERRLFNFNKYIKQFKEGAFYRLDSAAAKFFIENYDESLLQNLVANNEETTALIPQITWDSIYKKGMEPVRIWMKTNQTDILNTLN
jgi:DNA polymerase-3 subunit alpha